MFRNMDLHRRISSDRALTAIMEQSASSRLATEQAEVPPVHLDLQVFRWRTWRTFIRRER